MTEQAVSAGEVAFDSGDPVLLFTKMRLQEIDDDRLPAAMEAKLQSEARRLCDIAKTRISAWRQHAERTQIADTTSIEAVIETVQQTCSSGVSEWLLDDFIGTVEALTPGEQQETRCEAGIHVMAFIYDNPTPTKAVIEKRDQVFELCPALEKQWQKVDEHQR